MVLELQKLSRLLGECSTSGLDVCLVRVIDTVSHIAHVEDGRDDLPNVFDLLLTEANFPHAAHSKVVGGSVVNTVDGVRVCGTVKEVVISRIGGKESVLCTNFVTAKTLIEDVKCALVISDRNSA